MRDGRRFTVVRSYLQFSARALPILHQTLSVLQESPCLAQSSRSTSRHNSSSTTYSSTVRSVSYRSRVSTELWRNSHSAPCDHANRCWRLLSEVTYRTYRPTSSCHHSRMLAVLGRAVSDQCVRPTTYCAVPWVGCLHAAIALFQCG